MGVAGDLLDTRRQRADAEHHGAPAGAGHRTLAHLRRAAAAACVEETRCSPPRRFLFLQGPISPFFSEVAAGLRALGHAAHRINLCLGDRLFWRGPGAVDFRGRAEDWPAFVGAFLDRHAITDLVLLGEQRPLHRAAIAEARGRGIGVAVTDFGYLRPDWIVLERDGMGAESRFPRDPEAIRALAARCPEPDLRPRYADDFAAQARWDILYHLASLAPWPFRHYRRFLLHHPVPAYLGTGWRLLRRAAETRRDAALLAALRARRVPLFLFAMQMETDYSIRAYSRFPDNDSAIAEVVASFARAAPAEAQLLVKLHPLDPGLKRWRQPHRAHRRDGGGGAARARAARRVAGRRGDPRLPRRRHGQQHARAPRRPARPRHARHG